MGLLSFAMTKKYQKKLGEENANFTSHFQVSGNQDRNLRNLNQEKMEENFLLTCCLWFAQIKVM